MRREGPHRPQDPRISTRRACLRNVLNNEATSTAIKLLGEHSNGFKMNLSDKYASRLTDSWLDNSLRSIDHATQILRDRLTEGGGGCPIKSVQQQPPKWSIMDVLYFTSSRERGRNKKQETGFALCSAGRAQEWRWQECAKIIVCE